MDAIRRALETLGLSDGATLSDIKQAYRDLARVWHPDRFPNDVRLRRKAEEKLKEINEAYEILERYASILRANFNGSCGGSVEPTSERQRCDPRSGTNRNKQEDGTAKATNEPRKQANRTTCATSTLESKVIDRCALMFFGAFWAVCGLAIVCRMAEGPLTGARPYEPNPAYVTRPSFPVQPTLLPSTNLETGDPFSISIAPPADGENLAVPIDAPTSKAIAAEEVPQDAPESATVDEPKGYFTVGSTKDEVLVVQGTPTRINDDAWDYGYSTVRFSAGKVTGWNVITGSPLKVRMEPSQPIEATTNEYSTVEDERPFATSQRSTSKTIWPADGSSSGVFRDGIVTSSQLEAQPNSSLKSLDSSTSQKLPSPRRWLGNLMRPNQASR